MNIVRILKHPVDRECVLLDCAPDLNSTLTRFGPARVSKDDRAYVVHHSHIDAFYRFARMNDLHVVDDRRVSGPARHGARIPPIECRNCGQPGSYSNPPTTCPACGETWIAIPPPVRDDPITKTPCTKCGHKQPGRFRYCSRCGNPMTYKASPKPVTLPRTKLADPVPLSQTVPQTVETFQQDAHRSTKPRPPYLPERDAASNRPIEDTPLPAAETDPATEYDPTEDPDWSGNRYQESPEQEQAEPDPKLVERQHMVNAAQAAVRHQPVPDRSVAVQQVTDGHTPHGMVFDEVLTQPPTVERMPCCGRWPSQPHDETCPTRTADETPPTPTPDAPVEEELPYDRWGSW